MLINSLTALKQANTISMKAKQAAFGSQEEEQKDLEETRAAAKAQKEEFYKALERKRIAQREKDIERFSNGGQIDYFLKGKGEE